MAICDKINTAGTTLQTNLNARGVTCTYGKNSDGKQTINDMANLITASNLKGSADSIIHISASRPYLLEDETTDLIVTLHNGVGNPLANKTIEISDGTSVYNGITNNQGLFVLYDVTLSATKTFTATYNTVSDSVTLIYADFVDYGVSSKYTNWSNGSNMTIVRTDAYSYTQQTDATSFGYVAQTITSGDTVEADVCSSGLGVSSTFISIRKGTTSVGTVTLQNLGLRDGEWGHMKLVLDGTSMDVYCNGVFKTTRTLSVNDYNGIQFGLNANATNTQRFKNFVIY